MENEELINTASANTLGAVKNHQQREWNSKSIVFI
jgi:hypothetical protein